MEVVRVVMVSVVICVNVCRKQCLKQRSETRASGAAMMARRIKLFVLKAEDPSLIPMEPTW